MGHRSPGWQAAGRTLLRREFAHAIPNRVVNLAGEAISEGIGRSRFNGNYVTAVEHALTDPYRYRFMPRAWKALNPMKPYAMRMLLRIPRIWVGAGAGAAYGAGGAEAAAAMPVPTPGNAAAVAPLQ